MNSKLYVLLNYKVFHVILAVFKSFLSSISSVCAIAYYISYIGLYYPLIKGVFLGLYRFFTCLRPYISSIWALIYKGVCGIYNKV